jgi:hypothetical protein
LQGSTGYIPVLENPDTTFSIVATLIKYACKLLGRYLLMGVTLHEAAVFSIEGTFQRAKQRR